MNHEELTAAFIGLRNRVKELEQAVSDLSQVVNVNSGLLDQLNFALKGQ